MKMKNAKNACFYAFVEMGLFRTKLKLLADKIAEYKKALNAEDIMLLDFELEPSETSKYCFLGPSRISSLKNEFV